MSATRHDDDPPIEVSLVRRVKGCRTCKWFWGPVPPYGPYPSFDWELDFPEAFLRRSRIEGRVAGRHLVDPSVLHGCRKAPIMTIGINPNLTAYYPSSTGMRWTYPHFESEARYAYYYRYRTVHQEAFSRETVRDWLDPGSMLVAAEGGVLTSVERSTDHRWMQLRVRYDSGREAVHELAWSPERRAVVLVDPRRGDEGGEVAAGDVLAGVLLPPEGARVDVLAKPVGYYQRFEEVLRRFERLAALDSGSFRIGEDVSQHDMIACASPGWSSRYDIPRQRIVESCVTDHAYVLLQLLQSRPAVIVVVGSSSMAMFASMFGAQLEIDGPDRDVFQLLVETTRERRVLRLEVAGFRWEARVLVSPHFSYSDNFVPHARLSAAAWRAFQQDFAMDAARLIEAERVRTPGREGVVAIRWDGALDALALSITPAGRLVLDAYFHDPLQMMAEALEQERGLGHLRYDEATRRLARSEGDCRFCDNDQWRFPDGCQYSNAALPATSWSTYEALAREVLARRARGGRDLI